jgi:hypothetical protein
MEWLGKNKEWIFSGIGVVIFAGLAGLISRWKSRACARQNQSIKNSTSVTQVGGSVNIGKSNGRTKR